MSILLYKQRHRYPNFKETAGANYAHVRYVATSLGGLKNENGDYNCRPPMWKLSRRTTTRYSLWGISRTAWTESRMGRFTRQSLRSISPEQEKREDHAEQTKQKAAKAEELAEAAESTGVQQDVESEAGEVPEPEQTAVVAVPKEKVGYAEPVAGAVTGVIETKNENVSGKAAVYDRDSVFSHNVDGGGVHSAIPLNYPFNQKLKAKKKYYRAFRGRIFRKMAEAVKKWLFPSYDPHPENSCR